MKWGGKLTEKEYNEAPGIRRSALWRMSESPEKYKYFLEHPPESTPALIFGSAVHKLLLEPVDFEDEYAVAPPVDRRTKVGKETWEEFCRLSEGKTIITQDDFDTMAAMVEKANSVPYVRNLLKGKREVPLFWTDADTGERCKAKLDILTEMDGRTVIADYKSAANAKTEVFNNKLFSIGYHLQAYMYTEGAMKVLGLTERPDFIFIVQEKTAPYAVNLIEVTEDVMLAGMDCFREYIGLVHQCKETDYWWGYTGMFGEPNEAFLPRWMQMGDTDE